MPSLTEGGRSLQHTVRVFSGTVLAAEEESCMLPEVGTVETADFNTVTQPYGGVSVVVIVVVVVGDVVVGAVATRTLNTKHKPYVSERDPHRRMNIQQESVLHKTSYM
jgi:hypothetical protein